MEQIQQKVPEWIPEVIEKYCSFNLEQHNSCAVLYNNTIYESQTTDACVFHIILLLYENAPLPKKRPAFHKGLRLIEEGEWTDLENNFKCLNEMMRYTDGRVGLSYGAHFITLYFLDHDDDVRRMYYDDDMSRLEQTIEWDTTEEERLFSCVSLTKKDILIKYALRSLETAVPC